MTAPAIVWFRRNLRLTDNPALLAALQSGRPVLPVYVHDGNDAGAASDWWLHHSLAALAADLASRGSPLVVLAGSATDLLPRITALTGAATVYYAKAYTALAVADEEAVSTGLQGRAVEVDDYYLHAPGTVLTGESTPYRVYTPFWKACRALGEPPRAAAAPARIPACPPGTMAHATRTLPVRGLDTLGLLPVRPDWAGGLASTWRPGEAGALRRLAAFVDPSGRYADERDRPDLASTSRLSPHLHFGEISPRQVWHAVNDAAQAEGGMRGAEAFLRQLYWRDFSGHLLYHFPELPAVPLKSEFRRFPWAPDAEHFRAWQAGRTGYPIIDAGMRELWTTGWMHNRVRMIVASFLVKNLLIPWQNGAAWFLDTLVDADLANNSASWQWVAGCGTDAAPYFRIFNPVTQSRKFDPQGRYIRRWIPELAKLSNADIHEPWLAASAAQRSAGIEIGEDYPEPIVALSGSRDRALDAYRAVRSLLQSPAASPGSSAG